MTGSGARTAIIHKSGRGVTEGELALYAVLILVFVLAFGANPLMARLMPRH